MSDPNIQAIAEALAAGYELKQNRFANVGYYFVKVGDRDDAPHVYPTPTEAWARQKTYVSHGAQLVQQLFNALVDSIAEAGELGCPAGLLFAGLGTTQSQFDALMRVLEQTGRVRRDGDLYFIQYGGYRLNHGSN